MNSESCQVAIIGAGPGGLAVAAELGSLGAGPVVVLEREAAAGGIPRHCGHSPFGMREFHRLLSGPAYARRLAQAALDNGADIRLQTTVTGIGPDGGLLLATPDGVQELSAERVVISTGNRETPRSARLVSGSRPPGIVTTGALQSMVYLKHRLPFRRPLIVGTELISFSALLTCRHAGIRPVAMIDQSERVVAPRFAALLPRLLGTRLLLGARIRKIQGRERVSAVEVVDGRGSAQTLDCDGVVFSGNFVAESALIRTGLVAFDGRSGGPRVDQYGRCSDPDFFACGNLLHPVDTAGWCWAEGRRLAHHLFASLNGDLPAPTRIIEIESVCPEIKYFTPQRIVLPLQQFSGDNPGLQIRFTGNGRGTLCLHSAGEILLRRKVNARREQRVLMPLPQAQQLPESGAIALDFVSA